MMRFVFSFVFIAWSITSLSAQKVTVSPDINIRNASFYHIIGQIDDNILLFLDDRNEQTLHLFDDNLVLKSERQINLLGDNPLIYEVLTLDTTFAVIYGYRDEDEHVVQMDVFSTTATVTDSVEIIRSEKRRRGLSYRSVRSDNDKVVGLYNFLDDNHMRLVVFDAESKSLHTNFEYLAADLDFRDDMIEAKVSDYGHFYILKEIDNTRSKRESHYAQILQFAPGDKNIHTISIPMFDMVSTDIRLSLDNHNKRLGLVALYDQKRNNRSQGYLWSAGPMFGWENPEIHIKLFDEGVSYELYGSREDHIDNFTISDVLYKRDGMPIFLLEMSLEVQRSAQGNSSRTARRRSPNDRFNPLQNWADFYREDIVALSLDENADTEWYQVFYKKQFSQNDGAIFSSFFAFSTPSRTRLLFNDAIKNNSSVSEYVFDGMGNHKRNSVLSTEYQNLKLRFQDAVQVSSEQVIVPSQSNFNLNLIKIDFGL